MAATCSIEELIGIRWLFVLLAFWVAWSVCLDNINFVKASEI